MSKLIRISSTLRLDLIVIFISAVSEVTIISALVMALELVVISTLGFLAGLTPEADEPLLLVTALGLIALSGSS